MKRPMSVHSYRLWRWQTLKSNSILGFFREEVPLYSSTGEAFWDDDHISKGMLEAHLDPERDAASKGAETIQQSVNWIHQLVQERGYQHLLDLGCGPGLYSTELAQRIEQHF